MTDACAAANQASGFIGSMTGYLDCQSQTLGLGAWAALASPGSSLALLLSGLLTIFIALIGYNLLLGSTLNLREMTISFVKIGAVFALATSWPSYRTVVYDLVTNGPDQLVAEIGPRAGVAGSDGSLIQRLDNADWALVQLSNLGAGQARPEDYQQVQASPFIGFDSFALGGSRILFLMSAIAGLGIVRLVAGLLLALGPFFIAFFLFDGTRSLFEGWIRVLGGAALSSVAVSVVLGMELGLAEPWLGAVLARRMAGEALPAVPTELFAIVGLFAIALIASIYASMRLVGAFRLPWLRLAENGMRAFEQTQAPGAIPVRGARGSGEGERTRAVAIAGIVAATGPRGRDAVDHNRSGLLQGRVPEVRPTSNDGRQHVPLGQSFSRRPGARVSALAAKRDSTR